MSDRKSQNLRLKAFPGNKYYRIHFDSGLPYDLSELSQQLHGITGYFADEYVSAAKSIDNIYSVISDESEFKGHVCVSTVILRFEDAVKMIEEAEPALDALCKEYKLTEIHFADIIGRNSLGRDRDAFLQRYIEIVSKKDLSAIAFSTEKSRFLSSVPFENVSDSELYFILFWNLMEYVVERLPLCSIFHINFEQDNNLSVRLISHYIGKLHDGIALCKAINARRSSICKYPMFFSKRALLFSSLSDLAAYSNNVLQQKLDGGIPVKKVRQNHDVLIKSTRKVFKQFWSMHQSRLGAADLICDDGMSV